MRRLAKWLPMDAEDADRLDQMVQRDDSLGAPHGDADASPLIIDGEASPGTSRIDAMEEAFAGAQVIDGTATEGAGK